MAKILISTLGSFGDMRPAAALASYLSPLHQVTIISSPDYRGYAESRGLSFAPAGGSFALLLARPSLGRFRSEVRAQVSSWTVGSGDVDCVLAMSMSYGGSSLAERLGVPYRYLAFSPQIFTSVAHDPMDGCATERLGRARTESWRKYWAREDWMALSSLNAERLHCGLRPLETTQETRKDRVSWLAADEILAPLPDDVHVERHLP